jgi:hypothetical protein
MEIKATHIGIFYKSNLKNAPACSQEPPRQKCSSLKFEVVGNIAFTWGDTLNPLNSAY